MKEWDPTGRNGPRTPLPDVVKVSSSGHTAGTLAPHVAAGEHAACARLWGVVVGPGHQAHAFPASLQKPVMRGQSVCLVTAPGS
jgi:hypothetical protein